jgi:hypothetical protein
MIDSSSSSIVLMRLSGPNSKTNYISEQLETLEIEPATPGYVAMNSDHQNREANDVHSIRNCVQKEVQD